MKRATVFALLITLSLGVLQGAEKFTAGQLQLEFWQGKVKEDVEGGTAGAPDSVQFLSLFQWPEDGSNEAGANYTVRVTGFFVPPTTGKYIIFVDADDTADLWLSTDDTAANKQMVAQQPGWSNQLTWTTDNGGGTDLRQRRSDTWLPAGAATAPFAAGIPLVAGTHYYIEGVMNEFGGGDNFAATFKLVGEPDPTDGDFSKMTGNLIGTSITAPSLLVVTNQPQNATVTAGTLARFSVGVQTDAKVNGGPLPPNYQWRKGGVNIVGATAASTSFFTSESDNGAKIDVVVSFPAATGFTNTVTSSAATLTVQAGATVNGKLKDEFFSGKARSDVESGNGGTPTFVDAFTSFHAPVNFAEAFTRRVSGYFTPAASGNYVFFVYSDDDSDLFLSTDDSPANKRLIAREVNWSNDLQWTSSGGGSDVALKRSDQFSPDGGTTKPFSGGIALVAGTKYYIEGVAHEGGGGDNFGATFKLLADPDPADDTPTKLTNGVISFVTSPVTTLAITTQPQTPTVYEGQTLTLSVVAQTDSELTPLYQWRKGGVNIAGATAATYTVASANAASDNGSYDVVITLANDARTVTSSPVTVNVQTAPFVTGYLKYEYFPGSDRPTVEAGTAGNPYTGPGTIGSDKSGATKSFESGVTFADNYANRFSGFFVPPTTGDYVFFVAGDDDSDLFLSTDDKPANKRMIAQEASWSNNREWITAGFGDAALKRSDQWSPDGGTTVPFAAGIHMVAGTRYYIEGVHHEGGGGDDFGATYKLIADPDPADNDASKLTGDVIGILVPPQSVTFTQQPQSVTAAAATTATFTVGATTDGFYPPSYQWKKGGVDIAGATGSSYTTPVLTLADNGSQFVAAVSILGANPTNSQTATLTVTPDVTLPTLVRALRGFSDNTKTTVLFSEAVQAASANLAANYTFNNGITVSAAALQADGKSVILTTSPITAATGNTLTVKGVLDLAGNQIAASSPIDLGLQKGIYFVTADPGPLTFAGDIAVNQHLLDRGFDVELARGSDVPDDGATALGRDLIIQSSSLGSGTVEVVGADPIPVGKFKNLAIPAMEWEASSVDAFGFQDVNAVTTGGQTQVNIVDASSPLAAGFPNGLVTVTKTPETFSQSTPVGAHIVATLASDSTQDIIYNYDKGEKGFNDFVMPARRVFFFFQDNTAAVANDNGWKLFDAAVDWLLGVEILPPIPGAKLTATIAGNNLTVSWTPAGGKLQSTAVLAGAATVWKDVGTTNPATVPISGGSLFLRVISP